MISKKYSIQCSNLFTEFTPPVWFFCMTSFNHWLLIVNASCNFLIYVSVGDKFKTAIDNFCKSKLGCCFRKPSSPNDSNKSVPMLLINKSDAQESTVTKMTIRTSQHQVIYFSIFSSKTLEN